MAGIGFEIRKLLARGTPLDALMAYGQAAIVSAGPWLVSVLTLAALSWIVPPGIPEGDLMLFRTIIIYAYAASLIVTGIFLMPFTRHLADRIYLKDAASVTPAFLTSAGMTAAALAIVAVPALLVLPLSGADRVFSGSIFLLVGLVWHAMTFVSATRDYRSIVRAFVLGSAVVLCGAWSFGRRAGLTGYLAGFATGQTVLWLLLVRNVLKEFPAGRVLDPGMALAVRKFPSLAGTGLLYGIGIWIDKGAFWYAGPGEQVSGFLKAYPAYDSAMFLAYLTTLPAFSIFLIQVETDFYERYRRFYLAIQDREPLSRLEQRHRDLGEAMNRGLWTILKWQGAVTVLCLLFAEFLAEALNLDPSTLGIFRVGILGAYLQVLFLVTLILVLYFDLRKVALGLSAAFCLLCGLFTLVSIRLGYAFYGYGYLLAALVGFVLAYGALRMAYDRLLFLTFTGQPISPPGPEATG